jgi:hypothetical protein
VAGHHSEGLTLAGLAAGAYELTVGLFTDDADWQPMLCWYLGLASVTVAAPGIPTATPEPRNPDCLDDPAYTEQRPANAPANATRASRST